jgi:hypothetical protein
MITSTTMTSNKEKPDCLFTLLPRYSKNTKQK